MNDTSRTDIVTVDLSKPLRRENCGTLLATGDENANRFGAEIVRKGKAVDLTGHTVSGSFIRPDGVTLNLDGTAEGNTVYIDLPASCYKEDGVFTLSIKIIKEGYTHTVRMVDGYIRRTDTGNYVATEETIISIDQMKGLADAMAETNKEAKELIADMNEASDGFAKKKVDLPTDEEGAVLFGEYGYQAQSNGAGGVNWAKIPQPCDISSVVGDGVTDDSAAIQALLDNFDYVYLPKGTYYITGKWLEMLRDNVTFICDGTLLVNTTQALVLSASHCNVKIAHIKCKYNGTWTEVDKWKFITSALKLHAVSNSVMYNTIEVGYIERCINGFWLVPDGEGMGIAHNIIKFGDVYAERGIYFDPGEQKWVYINSNHFYGGQLRGNHPIYTRKGANQSDPFNGNNFIHIAMEGCQKPMTLNFFCQNKFENMRCAETENGAIVYPAPLIVFDTESFGNIIESHEGLNVDRIVDPCNTSIRGWERWIGNLYKPRFFRTGEISVSKVLGVQGRTCYGHMIIENDFHMTTAVHNTTLDLSADNYAVIGRTFTCKADTGNATIILPMGYRQRSATEFYVYVESITAPYTVKVVQEGVDIIPDTAMTETGLYKAELLTAVGWVVSKVDDVHFALIDSLPESKVEPSTLKMWAGWYDSAAAGAGQDTITEVTFTNNYEGTGAEDANWAADTGNTGSIMAYRTGTSVVITTTDGAKKIKMNPDSRFMFANSGNEESGNFASLATINGTELLVADAGTNAEKLCDKNAVLTTPIVIPEGVVNLKSAFSGCSALTEAPAIPSSVTNMQSAFINCSALVTLPNIPENVTNMAWTFQSCKVANGTIEVNAQNLTDYTNAFYLAPTGADCHITLTGSCPVLAEIAATNTQGKVTVAS